MAKADLLAGSLPRSGSNSPFSITPAVRNSPDESQQPLVRDALAIVAHQFVVIDPIEELFQINIDHRTVALRDVGCACATA